jgi:hypothetical protein
MAGPYQGFFHLARANASAGVFSPGDPAGIMPGKAVAAFGPRKNKKKAEQRYE